VKVLIPFPPPNEQVKIATLLSTFDLEIGKLEQRKNEVEIQKKGLMQQLLTGAVRVNPID
jgi:type I restriction enzyme S subunit